MAGGRRLKTTLVPWKSRSGRTSDEILRKTAESQPSQQRRARATPITFGWSVVLCGGKAAVAQLSGTVFRIV